MNSFSRSAGSSCTAAAPACVKWVVFLCVCLKLPHDAKLHTFDKISKTDVGRAKSGKVHFAEFHIFDTKDLLPVMNDVCVTVGPLCVILLTLFLC